jgi:hypothetical protein
MKFRPIDGMAVEVDDEEIIVNYSGEGTDLLLHQAHLADKIIDRCVRAHDSAR